MSDHGDGPVLVTVNYRVPPARLDELAELITYLEGHRRRTGAAMALHTLQPPGDVNHSRGEDL